LTTIKAKIRKNYKFLVKNTYCQIVAIAIKLDKELFASQSLSANRAVKKSTTRFNLAHLMSIPKFIGKL
jgi:hypothetical protein